MIIQDLRVVLLYAITNPLVFMYFNSETFNIFLRL